MLADTNVRDKAGQFERKEDVDDECDLSTNCHQAFTVDVHQQITALVDGVSQ